jgi:NADPH-dependent 2,4-dienoyl-CoA reductase/sulfur reductase-like enzyme
MASFQVQTGNQQEPPGLDGLAQYDVTIDGDDVVVDVPEGQSPHRTPEMAKYNPDADARTFAIVGAGIAGQTAAEMLRQQGFQGKIVMITQESRLPYVRTALSKRYLENASTDGPPTLRSPEFFAEHGIDVWCDRTVTALDPDRHHLTFASGDPLTYDQLLLATGGRARQLPVPGADLDNVFTLHQATDAEEIVAAVQGVQKAVVIGSSFIGMEAAASLTQAGLAVTVVSPESVPFEKILGRQLGQRIQALHEENGVKFCLGQKATGFRGQETVEAVELENGQTIPADLVVVGIGIEPATDNFQSLQLDSDGSVRVDDHLQSTTGVFAAGDIARFPDPHSDRQIRIEHWRLAAQHGRIAARNMLGQDIPFKGVPFFWSNQFSMHLHYVGHASHWDEVIIHGSLADLEFMVVYVEDDQIRAAATCGYAQDLIAVAELMRSDQLPSADMVRSGPVDWVAFLKSH